MIGRRFAAPTGAVALAAALGLASAACVDPLVDDELGLPGLVLPPGSDVPSAHDDPAIERQIQAGDGVEGEVRRIGGFAAGDPISYWDFGEAPIFAAPMFVLVRRTNDVHEPIDHPAIVDAIPGDERYSPFWIVLAVVVTDLYEEELLTSFRALQEAERLSLIERPLLQEYAVNRPIVARGVALEVGGEEPALLPPVSSLYWRGMTVNHYDFGRFELDDDVQVPVLPRYLVRVDGGEPANEVVRGVDFTEDGDLNDSNDVFPFKIVDTDDDDVNDADGYAPACRTVTVAVADGTEILDAPGEETASDITAAAQLFNPDPQAAVVAFEETDDIRNCPQQRAEGGL